MSVDTVFDRNMNPLFSGDPVTVKHRLQKKISPDFSCVCIGETQKIVTIPEYLYKEKYHDVRNLIKEVLRKQSLPMYARDPSKLEVHIDIAVKKILERAAEP